MRRRLRSRSLGSWLRSPGSCRSPARAGWSGWTKTSPRRRSSSLLRTCARSMPPLQDSTCRGPGEPDTSNTAEARFVVRNASCEFRKRRTPVQKRKLGKSCLEGAVTRTEFGRTKIGKPNSDSGGGGGSPRLESFRSEGAERATGCEMTLDVEGVVDSGVNGQEALG